MSTLVLPDPSLVVLVGAAGSGKSTLAARLFAPGEILSSDALRAVVSGDAANQRASAIAFTILHRTLDRRLAAGQLTVVDATNTRSEHRRPLVMRARAVGIPTVAIVLDLPPAQVHAQNTARTERVVGREVVDRHLAAIRRTMDAGQLVAEGFDHVMVVRSAEDVAGFRIERGPRRPQPVDDGEATTLPNARARSSTHTPLRR
jgi:protein phosphatase